MNKSIAKEIIIGLLLCLAILLILAVLLYSYIPNNKVIPELVSYTTPDEAKGVLKEAEVDTSKVIMTYEVNGNDLSTAQKTNSYKAGKVNPFSTYKPETTTTDGGTGNTSNAGTTSSGSTNSGSNTGNGNSGTAGNSDGTTSNGSSSTESGSTTENGSTGGTNSSSNSSSNGGTYYKNKGTK